MILLLGGFIIVVVGLLTLAFGIPIKEFSFGNTVILSGVIIACTGALVAAIALALREVKAALQGVPVALPGPLASGPARPVPTSAQDAPPPFLAPREESGSSPPAAADDAELPSDPVDPVIAPAEPQPAKPRRNLLFATSSRRERERAVARETQPSDELPNSDDQPSPRPPLSFESAWPEPERKGFLRRPRPGAAAPEPAPAAEPPFEASAAPAERYPPTTAETVAVTVVKSGVVDGMAYSLYSDGSIEAQMPEGMIRFASIDELRTHLEQRGG